MSSHVPALLWLEPWQSFPPCGEAWGATSNAPGLLAAGGELSPTWLLNAYRAGIFPWYSDGQPILWWSPDPRMVLNVSEFSLHRSLRKVIKRFRSDPECEIRFNTAFDRVIAACASSRRGAQTGTWILPEMRDAYMELHRLGFAHSVETWINGQLRGGLYLVAIGRAVFGESMFSLQTNTSKIALGALLAFCRENGVQAVDCQQNTRHLSFMGAREMSRADFVDLVRQASVLPGLDWTFAPAMWAHLD